MKVLKSLLAFSLLLAFLGSTLGIQVHKHYCGDFLADVSLYVQSNPCADEGGEEACSKGKTKSCCDDETEFYQLSIDLIKQQQQDQEVKYYPVLAYVFSAQLEVLDTKEDLRVLLAKPPPQEKVPLYKKFQRLTYYG